jgi:hypothetical protein
MGVQRLAVARNLAHPATHVQIVSQGNAMARCDLEDLVFTVTVEGRPLDILGWSRPIERHCLALVTHNELASFMLTRQAYHE